MVSEIPKPQESESHASDAAEAKSIARESMRLYDEWLKILWGTSDKQIPPKDPRFADPVWRDNPAYNRLAQSYLTFCDAVDSIVGENPDWRARERTRFLTGILTSAMAPTNTLWGIDRDVESGDDDVAVVGDELARSKHASSARLSSTACTDAGRSMVDQPADDIVLWPGSSASAGVR